MDEPAGIVEVDLDRNTEDQLRLQRLGLDYKTGRCLMNTWLIWTPMVTVILMKMMMFIIWGKNIPFSHSNNVSAK